MSADAQVASAVVRQGHLRKLKTMKKKYFVLRAETADTSARLEYYETEKKFKAGAAPRRVLPLKSCYNITRRLDLKQKHVIALFTKEEQFCIVAENEQDLHAWLTAILKQHRNDDASEELLHPTQHVWQVNVQKKGLGATKNIQGLYNLCLTDKTLTLVKIKSQNNVISDLGIPERIEYSLKNIRRCGDSECFFYMEVGRQTATGAGELWMLSDDSNIAQSMHSTIYHAMRNCAKETENERDHIIIPKGESNQLPARRQTYSDGRGRAGLSNVENQPPNNSLTDKEPQRTIKHHRTVSLPTGCLLFQEPLKIVHERTRSAPLTGDEVDRAILEKTATHSSCKAVNGTEMYAKKSLGSRRASTGAGTRLSKLSPAHSKNASTLRNRCDSMPSRACSSFEAERPSPRLNDLSDGLDSSRDEIDSDWHRTPRIPEEPDFCDPIIKDILSRSSVVAGSSRTSSVCLEDGASAYLPMSAAQPSLSTSSLASGTPSTDPRFSSYQLEPATSHIVEWSRPVRAYSVGSRAPPLGGGGGPGGPGGAGGASGGAGGPAAARSPPSPPRLRAHSTGHRPQPHHTDLMELDFTNKVRSKVVMSGTPPPVAGFRTDEYVSMSPGDISLGPGESSGHSRTTGVIGGGAPRTMSVVGGGASRTTGMAGGGASRATGYVEMTPGEHVAQAPPTPDGYVEMNYGRPATRPIPIAVPRSPPPVVPSPPDDRRRRAEHSRTPLGSQTLFPISIDSPASPPEDTADVFDEEMAHHPLTTVREISEEGGRKSPEVSSSPSYVKLVMPNKVSVKEDEECNPVKISAVDNKATEPGGPLNYAALDLQPRLPAAGHAPLRTYTQIDFVRSEKLAADSN